MNIVAIDPSLTCTAIVVNDKKFVYTSESVALTKKGEFKGWFQECKDNGITIRVFNDIPPTLIHSDLEICKLSHYSNISNTILDDILDNVNVKEVSHIGIEGYSYSSASGPLIDLVTFSTLLRYKLFLNISPPVKVNEISNPLPSLTVFQPTEVKQLAAKLTYPAISTNKANTKFEWRNNEGVAGGSFKKPEIYKALIENKNLQNDVWVNYLNNRSEDIFKLKNIPKPIEDINDAKILYEILKSTYPLNK